jgi:hypothetical protein
MKTLAESKFSIIFTSELKPTLKKHIIMKKLEFISFCLSLAFFYLFLGAFVSLIAEWLKLLKLLLFLNFFFKVSNFSRY